MNMKWYDGFRIYAATLPALSIGALVGVFAVVSAALFEVRADESSTADADRTIVVERGTRKQALIDRLATIKPENRIMVCYEGAMPTSGYTMEAEIMSSRNVRPHISCRVREPESDLRAQVITHPWAIVHYREEDGV